MSDLVFRASVRGAGPAAAKIGTAPFRLQRELRDAIDDLGDTSQAILRAAAPHERDLLREGIVAQPVIDTGFRVRVEISATVHDPDSGYDYVDVSRFGHRRDYIYPTRAKSLRIRESQYGPVRYVARVRGYHPATDWVSDARPALDQAARATAERVGRAIDTRVLR